MLHCISTGHPARVLLAAIVCAAAAASARAEDAASIVRDIFGAKIKEVRASKTPLDDIALAQELLAAADAAAKTPELVEQLCENAFQLTKDVTGGHAVAVNALERLAQAMPAKKIDALTRAAGVAQKGHSTAARDQRAPAADRYLGILCQLALAREETKDNAGALDTWRKALVLAGATQSVRSAEIKSATARVQERVNLENRVGDLESKVLENAKDGASVLALVRCYLVEMDDPQRASRFVDRLADDEFKRMTPLAAKDGSKLSPAERFAVADWYGKLAKEVNGPARAMMQKRAVAHYRAFLESPDAAADQLRSAKALLSIQQFAPDEPPLGRPATAPGTTASEKGMIRLVDLKPLSTSVPLEAGWQIDRVPTGVAEPVTAIDAGTCREFLFAHAPSKLTYSLPAGAESFSAIGFCERRSQVQYRVLIDDTEVFSSRGSMAVINIKVPAGSKTIALAADDLGTFDWKHTFWCFPTVHSKAKKPGEAASVSLTSLPPLSTEIRILQLGVNGYGNDRWPCVTRDAAPCKEYLWAPPPSSLEYDIPAGAKRFTAVAYSVAGGDAQFRLIVDGRTLFRADYAGIVPVDVSLPAGAKRLVLQVDPTLNWMEHSFWCFPRLHMSDGPAAKPAAVNPRPKGKGQEIDLLANLDLDNATQGVWGWRAGALVGQSRFFAKTDFGYQVRGSYEMEVAFTRAEGREGVTLHLPVGDTWTLISLGGWQNRFHGLHALDTGLGDSNETTRKGGLETNRRYVAVASVTLLRDGEARIALAVDGAAVFEWEGAISRLRHPNPQFTPPDPTAVGIGANVNELIVHEAWLRPADGASVRRMDRSIARGFVYGAPYMDMPRDAGLLAGLRYTTTKFHNRWVVLGSLQPVYVTPAGRELGAVHGEPAGEATEVVAKPGYAIGAMEVRGGMKADAFRCTFMRITTTGLDPRDSYQSDWHGGAGGGASLLTSAGRPIVGIYGRKSSQDIDSLGIVYAPPGRLSAWQNPAKAVAERLNPVKVGPPEAGRQTFFGIPIE